MKNLKWYNLLVFQEKVMAYQIYHFFISLICLGSSYFYMYVAAFAHHYDEDQQNFEWVAFIFEMIFLFDMILQFFNEKQNEYEHS
mmetsp:Transcript_27534/g.41833  ORF Transcript_27534/g.41833 Transcript_27534/m.41833 type:complete len:85 (+) Transcript_27534:202-456(+)